METFFSPKSVNDFFVKITQLSHCSGKENPVRLFIIDIVNDYNKKNPFNQISIIHFEPDAVDPGRRVIVLRRDGSVGMENRQTIILQSHMDMACVPGTSGHLFPIKINSYFDKELNSNVLKGGGITPQTGTTLGADGGIGLAVALAIITDSRRKCGPIECLFTVQEETNMGGARAFDVNLLSGKILINLDYEECNKIVTGNSGGTGIQYRIIPQCQNFSDFYNMLSISVCGLRGGHSGVNIKDGNANAIKVLIHLLNQLRNAKQLEFNIVQFSAGTTPNAIPNSALVSFAFKNQTTETVKIWCETILSAIKSEFKSTDPDFTASVQLQRVLQDTMLNVTETNRLCDLLTLLPNGPVKMMADSSDVVEASATLEMINVSTNEIDIKCSVRSISEKSMECIEKFHRTIAELNGIKMVLDLNACDTSSVMQNNFIFESSGVLIFSGRYPGWKSEMDSELLKIARDVYDEVYKGDFVSSIIHTGLECGWIVKKFTKASKPIDCIAIGPSIKTPHTWNERLVYDTVSPFFTCVNMIMNRIWNKDNMEKRCDSLSQYYVVNELADYSGIYS